MMKVTTQFLTRSIGLKGTRETPPREPKDHKVALPTVLSSYITNDNMDPPGKTH